MRITPAILSSNIDDFTHKLQVASTLCTSVQIDIATPEFAGTSSVAIDSVISVLDKSKLSATYHLMTRDIIGHIKKLHGHKFHRIIIHAETDPDYKRIIKLVDRQKRGLAINPETPIADVLPLLDDFDELLIMTVHPGHSGGRFLPETLSKIERAKQCFPHLTVSADGGIDGDNIPTLRNLGYDIAYIGSAIFTSPNPRIAFTELNEQGRIIA